ncbi:MAG TPA: hypothetical protein VGH40_23930 [Roseiarcus sp.]|jgi:hypothetical protein
MAPLLLRKIGKSHGPVRAIEALSLNGDLHAFDAASAARLN